VPVTMIRLRSLRNDGRAALRTDSDKVSRNIGISGGLRPRRGPLLSTRDSDRAGTST
jgi:hypothetical protein